MTYLLLDPCEIETVWETRRHVQTNPLRDDATDDSDAHLVGGSPVLRKVNNREVFPTTEPCVIEEFLRHARGEKVSVVGFVEVSQLTTPFNRT